MPDVSIRDLRNKGGDVVGRAASGEHLTITNSGRPVAILGPLPRQPLALDIILSRRAGLPPVDTQALRDDIDSVIDPAL